MNVEAHIWGLWIAVAMIVIVFTFVKFR